MLVLIGFNTAFRAEDLLQLKVKDLVHGHVCIKENKTGKTQVFNLRKELLEIIRDYVSRNKLTDYDYMFHFHSAQTVKYGQYQGNKVIASCVILERTLWYSLLFWIA